MPMEAPKVFATPGEECVHFLPISSLKKTYAVFRISGNEKVSCDLKALPLRVVATDDGHFEIIDGFKRLQAWVQEGRTRVPVVLESPGTRADHKRLLLLANRPRRTLNPLEEASVVSSLLEEDGLSVSAVAKLLGRSKEWILKRRAFVLHLSDRAQQALAQRGIGLTSASLLTGFPRADQDDLLLSAETHALTNAELLALLHTWKVTKTIAERRTFLKDPKAILKPPLPRTLSERARHLEFQLQQVQQAISDFRFLRLPEDLAPPERRRLQALYRAIHKELKDLPAPCGPTANPSSPDGPTSNGSLTQPLEVPSSAAGETTDSSHHHKEKLYVQTPLPLSESQFRRPSIDQRNGPERLGNEDHCPTPGLVQKNHPSGARRAWPDLQDSHKGAQDRSIFGADRQGGCRWPVGGTNLSRDNRLGLHGRKNHPRRPGSPRESSSAPKESTPHSQETFRDSSGGRNASGLVPGSRYHCGETHKDSPARGHLGPQSPSVRRDLPQ